MKIETYSGIATTGFSLMETYLLHTVFPDWMGKALIGYPCSSSVPEAMGLAMLQVTFGDVGM